MTQIRCELVAPDRRAFDGEADFVVLPGSGGELGVLPGHAPLTVVLRAGEVRVTRGTEVLRFTVTGGIAEVAPDHVTVLCDSCKDVSR